MGPNILLAQSYSLTAQAGQTNPLDATTYYFGMGYNQALSTVQVRRRIVIPVAGTIIAISGTVLVLGVLGSGESTVVSVRVNATTDTEVVDNLVLDAVVVSFRNSAMSVAVTVGNVIEIKMVTPTWVTNPTNTFWHATVAVEV